MQYFLKLLISIFFLSISLVGYAAPAKSKTKSISNTTQTVTTSTTNRTSSSKNEKHGDGGRAQASAEKQIAELQSQIYPGMPKNERLKIEQKIKNIKTIAAKKAKGEEHSKIGKR